MCDKPLVGLSETKEMRIVVVGQLNGKPHIRWIGTILAACLAGAIGAFGAFALSYLLSWPISPLALMFAFMGGVVVVGSGVMRALHLPIEQLTPL